MAGQKGMKHYPQSIRNEIAQKHQHGQSVRELSREYCISRYAIQSWCGLRPETQIRQIAPLKKGRPRKQPISSSKEMELKIKRLEMENELLRDFLRESERG
jgi:transposase